MQIIGNLFSIVIFVSMSGSLFALISLFLRKVFHAALPLWFGILGAVFFLVPFTTPQVRLLPGEEQVWLEGYITACRIWSWGALAFFLYYVLRSIFTWLAVRRLPVCEDERIRRIYREAGDAVGLKRLPPLRFGNQEDPACVAAVLRPAVLLNGEVMEALGDDEVKIVLIHELTHVRRLHSVWQRLFDLACCLHWPNILVWIAKSDFGLSCEIDCDHHSLRVQEGGEGVKEYAAVMLRLLELCGPRQRGRRAGISILSFFTAKQRVLQLYSRPSRIRRTLTAAVLAVCAAVTLLAAADLSRGYFYPSPGLDPAVESNSDMGR